MSKGAGDPLGGDPLGGQGGALPSLDMATPNSTVLDESIGVGAPARKWPALELLAAGGVAALLLRPVLVRAFDGPAARTWATM